MTVEDRIPLNEVQYALRCYASLYNCVHSPLKVYDYKTRIARRTLLSLVFSIIKIALFTVFVIMATNTVNDNGEMGFLWLIWLILSIVFGISIFLDLFYIQKISGKRLGKIKFRYPYYIMSLVNDIRELHWFRKYFGVKAPAFLLIFGIGKADAYQSIKNWGYMIGEDYCNYIRAYDNKYRSFREYVNLGQYWSVCDELLQIITSGRATSIQSALSVMDTRRHRERVERYQMEQAEAAVSAAEAAWSEAAAMDAVAANTAASAQYLKDIRDSLNGY